MRLKPSLASTPAQRFFRDGHNDLLTRGLNLTADSVVLDFGGYLGDWTAEIRKIYDSTVHVFEPIPDFADAIRLRFDGDGKVIVHQVAIGAEQGTMTIFLADDATGVGVQGDPVVVDVVGPGYLDAVGVGRCDVVAINIEGGEYQLLPALGESGFLARCERVFVQFHRIDEESSIQRERCHAVLAATHQCEWDYAFVWESWSSLGPR